MSLFGAPTSFRLNALNPDFGPILQPQHVPIMYSTTGNGTLGPDPQAEHPSVLHLMLLVFEAVMEVVCVSLPGYIIARHGLFDVENQKFVANLNVSLFTPCLIFTKLASQLTLSKMVELVIIPVLFVFMTAVSYCCSLAVAKIFGFEKRARNFVIAMGVFGNSNSLPISLVLSLAYTISGLHWDRIPGDNDSEVAARGILYLLIFQQLGQLLRWSWGYHVLLAAPTDSVTVEDVDGYRDDQDVGRDDDLLRVDPFLTPHFENSFEGLHAQPTEEDALLAKSRNHHRNLTTDTNDSSFNSSPSGDRTPVSGYPSTTSLSTYGSTAASSVVEAPATVRGRMILPKPNGHAVEARWATPTPPFIARTCATIKNVAMRFIDGFLSFMNPPLWAMGAAILVASVPQLQALFFTPGTLVNTSVTRAISESGKVAVPLILVVLGANLANSTSGSHKPAHADKQETRILIASLVSRMILPFLFTAPIIAAAAKYINISILDDPIFLVVCFLLTGAPSALQLAQICQINNVYEDVITRVLFWGYVVIILPSTLVLVISAIEVVHWAT